MKTRPSIGPRDRTPLAAVVVSALVVAASPFAVAGGMTRTTIQDSPTMQGRVALQDRVTTSRATASGSSASSSARSFGPAEPSNADGFGPRAPGTATSTIGSATGTESAPGETLSSATTVGPGVSAADRALMDQVVSALANDPQLKGAMITVQVDDGRVDLSGFAQDETQATRAREVAESVVGQGRVTGSLDTRS